MAGYSIDPRALQRGAARREIAVAKPGVRRVQQQFAPQPSATERREDMAIRAALQTGAGLIGALGQGAVQVGAKEGGWMHQAFTPDEILREQAIKRRLEREALAARTAHMRGAEGREGAKSDAAMRRAFMQQQMMTGRMREQQGLTSERMREQQGLMGEREQALARLKAMLKKKRGKGGSGPLSSKTQGFFDPATGQFVTAEEIERRVKRADKLGSTSGGHYLPEARQWGVDLELWIQGLRPMRLGQARKLGKKSGVDVTVGTVGIPRLGGLSAYDEAVLGEKADLTPVAVEKTKTGKPPKTAQQRLAAALGPGLTKPSQGEVLLGNIHAGPDADKGDVLTAIGGISRSHVLNKARVGGWHWTGRKDAPIEELTDTTNIGSGGWVEKRAGAKVELGTGAPD